MRRLVCLALALALAAAAAVGCGRDKKYDYSYTYLKAQISQDQLLQDERTLEHQSGVKRVTSKHNMDGSGTIEFAVDAAHRMETQQKMSALGYVRGEH